MMRRLLRIFLDGVRVFYGCKAGIAFKVVATPLILFLVLVVSMQNWSDGADVENTELSGGGTKP